MRQSHRYKGLVLICLIVCCVSFSGCALLQIPGQVIGGTFNLVGKLIQLAGKLPKPPPGVF